MPHRNKYESTNIHLKMKNVVVNPSFALKYIINIPLSSVWLTLVGVRNAAAAAVVAACRLPRAHGASSEFNKFNNFFSGFFSLASPVCFVFRMLQFGMRAYSAIDCKPCECQATHTHTETDSVRAERDAANEKMRKMNVPIW